MLGQHVIYKINFVVISLVFLGVAIRVAESYKAETKFSVYKSRSNEEVIQLRNLYSDTREGFWEEVKEIYSKIDLDFLK